MPLKDKNTGKTISSSITRISKSDFALISESNEFSFDWRVERGKEIYKICTKEKPEMILGLISLIDWPSEYRIHLNLIEVGKSNRGKKKRIEHIAGCLIAFACKKSFQRGYLGFVSLKPKTQLISYYKVQYGFQSYGPLLAIDQGASKSLVNKYLNDEEQ